MSLFEPDRYFSRISAIDIRVDLVAQGVAAVLLDVDNTIRSRADNSVPKDVRLWLEKLRAENIKACLLTNNFHANVFDLAKELDLPIVAKALKPLPKGYVRAAKLLGVNRRDTVMIGDQISTDIVGAHLVGMRAFLVCPLVEEDLRHTVVLRGIERIFIARRKPEGANVCETLRS